MPTLFRNGRVYTTAAFEVTAFVVDEGTITWMGTEEGIGQYAGTEVVDLEDAFVTPAFVDAHVHTTATGLELTGLSLAGAASLAEALDAVARAARANGGRPIVGGGWDDTGWPEQRPPTAAELDRASAGGAVYLARVDAHSAVVSSALAAAVPGLTALAGWTQDGLVTGAAHDAARSAAYAGLTAGQVRAAQLAALRHAASLGIACVHEMGGPAISSEDDLLSLLALAREDDALPEVIGYWAELGAVAKARELGAVGAAGDLFCDGSLGSHTAALREAYADDPGNRGSLRFATEELTEHVLACTEAGLQAGFHAIGDAAVDQVLDAVEAAGARLGRAGGAGHRIEHVEMVRDAKRLAASGLIASMQPMFDAHWGGPAGMYATRLGAARALDLNRFTELAAAGVPLAFGSDAPVTALGPWAAVRAAAYPHDPGAAISPRAAFAAHTRGGWRVARRDGEGMLMPGAAATFAVWQAGELAVDSPDERVSRWSTDPRSAVPGLPDIRPGVDLPVCRAAYRRGRVLFTR
ncbi:MAG: amidohydrolase [Jatrophihabitans sp.]|uniref:amidohydrolase n=1 Tax=Jatrophihabitans sp. TaxID=1932789 RepID=UPI003F80F45B